jgi:HEAT repeat protein
LPKDQHLVPFAGQNGRVTAFSEHDDFSRWVSLLADPVRTQRAYWHLVLSGEAALPAVREGLGSPNAVVRRQCTRALDHLVDEASFPTLVAMLDDPDPQVRIEALHALACDRCKDNACRPAAADVLGKAIALLAGDPDRHVRAYACELVGRWVHSHESARDAVVAARDNDPAPAVRKKAGWHAPGGTIFQKTAK